MRLRRLRRKGKGGPAVGMGAAAASSEWWLWLFDANSESSGKRFGEWCAKGRDDGSMMGDRTVAAQRQKGKGRRLVGPPLALLSPVDPTHPAPVASHACSTSALLLRLCMSAFPVRAADWRRVAVIGRRRGQQRRRIGGGGPAASPASPIAPATQCACRRALEANHYDCSTNG